MDLYGPSASIGQANAQTQEAREASIAATDFNNSLAEELDRANAEQDDDRKAAAQKNIVSGTASASKFIARDGLRKPLANKLGLSRAGKFVKTTFAERMGREAGAERTTAEEFTAEAADATGEAARPAAAALDESVTIGTSAAAREGEKVALETAEKTTGDIAKFAGKVGRVGIAGLGGGIDVAADVGRFMEGKRGLDMFGSNSAQRVGNIGNIVGSGLELAGLATAGIPPLGLTLEAAGAITGLVSSVVEGVGDEESAAESKEKEEQDITSQRRSQTVAQNVSTVTGRTM